MSDKPKQVKFDEQIKIIEHARMFRELKRSPRIINIKEQHRSQKEIDETFKKRK